MHTATAPKEFAKVVELHSVGRKFEVTCSSCNLREMCLPQGLCMEDLERVEKVVYARRRLRRGESLFNAGDEFGSVYAIRSGFFKTSVIDNEGREQVTGFFMGGELLGMDGIGASRYNGTAIALEDSEVCVMPFSLIEEHELPGARAAAPPARGAVARGRARPRRDDAARLDARRGAPGGVPAEPLQALHARAATRRPSSTCA